MLVQQYSLLHINEASEDLHASFVNIHGKPDGQIAADLRMEWLIQVEKNTLNTGSKIKM